MGGEWSLYFNKEGRHKLQKISLPCVRGGDGNAVGGVDYTIYTIEILKYKRKISTITILQSPNGASSLCTREPCGIPPPQVI
jgi:hypothetical protein